MPHLELKKYLLLKRLLSEKEKRADYLDYLHMQKVKRESTRRLSLAEVKRELAID
jgi:hypothetical protein